MKKYQLWLQRKTYSQHLSNLMRIRMSPIDKNHPPKMASVQDRHRDYSSNQTVLRASSPSTVRDLTYTVTAQQLQKHKLRLVRSNEIVRENEQMFKRIKQTKPFVGNKRPIDHTNYKLKRQMQRANEQHSTQLKQQKYQNFFKIHSQRDGSHRYQLSLNITAVDFRLPSAECAQMAIEVLAPKTVARSAYLLPQQLQNTVHVFPLPGPLPDDFLIQIHVYKGLEHSVLGTYAVMRPPEDSSLDQNWPAQALAGQLKARVTYQVIDPKNKSSRRFRI